MILHNIAEITYSNVLCSLLDLVLLVLFFQHNGTKPYIVHQLKG